MAKVTINELQEQLKEKQEIIDMQQKEIDTLKSKIGELKGKKHNERGAGRKSTLTDEQIEKVQELHLQGISYGAIAKEVELSKAYVYKLINKQNNQMTKEEYEKYREHINALRKGLREGGYGNSKTEDLPNYKEYIKNF